MEITSLFIDAFTIFSSEDLAVYPPFPSVILIEVLPFIESCAVELSNFSSFACGTWVVVVSSSFLQLVVEMIKAVISPQKKRNFIITLIKFVSKKI